MRKSELRHSYLSARKALSPDDRATKSKAISDRFFDSFDLGAIQNLHSFLPIDKFNEVDTRLIVTQVWKEHRGIQIVVPRVDFETNQLSSLKLNAETELISNAWGIDEPVHDDVVESDKIDMVLVPGLCFDRHGHRVGYGKGYYDGFLRTCRPDCVKIGLSYFEPIDRIDDVHDGDEAVDFVITPERLIGKS